MSTEYNLSLGYQSGYSRQGGHDVFWQLLRGCVESLRYDPEAIVAEARRLAAPETCGKGCCTLRSVAKSYMLDKHKGSPLVIRDPEGEDGGYVLQLTTGDRKLKEHVRRAFCRLVIERMHRLGIEVNLRVS